MTKKRKRRVTIYDLASELNVAPSTVSRALKDHFSIGKETINAVKELAQKRGYRPNTLASNLRKQQTNTIGVLVPWVNRPFISSLISGIEAEARNAGYNVIISQSQDVYENEVNNAKALFDSRIHAMIVSLAMETTDYDHLTEISRSGTPLVFVDRVPTGLDAHQVMIDNFTTGLTATQHLIDQGCRRIGLLGGAPNQEIYRERQRGYLAALERNGLPADQELIRQSNLLTIEEGRRLTEELLSLPNPPDGIFSTNDSAAVGGIKYATSQGLSIPGDIAFIGLNDDPVCTIIEPQLSTMTHPASEMGRMAVRQALNIDEIDSSDSEMVRLHTELVVRASSMKSAHAEAYASIIDEEKA